MGRRCRKVGAVVPARGIYPALTAASPSAQALTSGTTSTNVVFAPASGGSGVYTYGAPSTSAGTVSGTAPGTVTLSGLSDGSVAVVSVLVTDTRTGQTITQRCTVSVASGAAQAWDIHTDLDFTTGIASASSSATSGTLAVTTSGGAAYATVSLGGSGTATSRSVAVGSGGLTVSVVDDGDATSSSQIGAVQIPSPPDATRPVLIEVLVGAITLTTDSDSPAAALWLAPSATAAAGAVIFGPRYGAAKTILARLYSGASTSTQQEPSHTWTGTGRAQFLIQGSHVRMLWKTGATAFLGALDTAPDIEYAGSISASVAAPATTTPYSTIVVGGYVNAKGSALESTVRVDKVRVYQPGYIL
ncbi:hypothetical protein EBT31_17300 [bacterium]|nr:hypothetical protein [bacterium]